MPASVDAAVRRAAEHSFPYSCDRATGELLAVLAAAVPPGGRILELGTGAGVGLAWIVHGLGGRTDVSVLSIEQDPVTAGIAEAGEWPAHVTVSIGDAVAVLPGLGRFDLVFADAEGGKWRGLPLTLRALADRGVLLLDDMDPQRYELPEHHRSIGAVRSTLAEDSGLVLVDLPVASGIIIATRRPSA
ncbi:O-methyltransferase [Kitasatospora sp. NPDC057223]|uniref:O-methyltransferase n=1 Tax=Kitasatospora sp. NPDC057223 TaxID=3346055 RepID=UPI00362E9F15